MCAKGVLGGGEAEGSRCTHYSRDEWVVGEGVVGGGVGTDGQRGGM